MDPIKLPFRCEKPSIRVAAGLLGAVNADAYRGHAPKTLYIAGVHFNTLDDGPNGVVTVGPVPPWLTAFVECPYPAIPFSETLERLVGADVLNEMMPEAT